MLPPEVASTCRPETLACLRLPRDADLVLALLRRCDVIPTNLDIRRANQALPPTTGKPEQCNSGTYYYICMHMLAHLPSTHARTNTGHTHIVLRTVRSTHRQDAPRHTNQTFLHTVLRTCVDRALGAPYVSMYIVCIHTHARTLACDGSNFGGVGLSNPGLPAA